MGLSRFKRLMFDEKTILVIDIPDFADIIMLREIKNRRLSMKNKNFERFEAFCERGGRFGVKEWIHTKMDIQKVLTTSISKAFQSQT